MLELLKQIFTVWNSEKNQRLKLQQAYLILAIIGLVVAGLSTLFSVSSAHLAAQARKRSPADDMAAVHDPARISPETGRPSG